MAHEDRQVPEGLLSRIAHSLAWGRQMVHQLSSGHEHYADGVDELDALHDELTELLEAVPVQRPDDIEALPEGYTTERSSPRSSYYTLTAPDGTQLKGPSNGKYQGKDAAANAAWRHAEGG